MKRTIIFIFTVIFVIALANSLNACVVNCPTTKPFPGGPSQCWTCNNGTWVCSGDFCQGDCYKNVCDASCDCEEFSLGGIAEFSTGKSTGGTVYFARDNYDYPPYRIPFLAGLESLPNDPDSYILNWLVWTPGDVHPAYPYTWPDKQAPGTTLYLKDHGMYSAAATCTGSSFSMNIGVGGINMVPVVDRGGIPPEREEPTPSPLQCFNVFRNGNFDQGLGSGVPDYTDNSIAGDNMDEIGFIGMDVLTNGDISAQIKFNGPSGCKLYNHSKQYMYYDVYYPVDTVGSPIYIEGTASSGGQLTATLMTSDCPAACATCSGCTYCEKFKGDDKIWIGVKDIDLSSYNPGPLGGDLYETTDVGNLIIPVNNNDSDDDGIVDLEDGYVSVYCGPVAPGDPDLAVVTLGGDISEDPEIDYSDFHDGIITITFSSNINVYTTRNKNTESDGSGTSSQISFGHTISVSDTALLDYYQLFIEGAAYSSGLLDAYIRAEVKLDSKSEGGNIVCSDEIKYSVVSPSLTLYVDEGDGLWAPFTDGWGHCWWSLDMDGPVEEMFGQGGAYNQYEGFLGPAGWWPTTLEQGKAPFPSDLGYILSGSNQHGSIPDSQYTWGITFDDMRAVFGMMEGIYDESSNVQWNALSQNCTDMAILIGEAAGIETIDPDGLTTPLDLSVYLQLQCLCE